MRDSRIWVLVAGSDAARLYCSDEEITELTPALPRELHAPDAGWFSSVITIVPDAGEADVWNEPVEMWDVPEAVSAPDCHASFAGLLAKLLQEGASENAYDGLIIAASPGIMAMLDRALSAETRSRLLGQITGDLTHLGPAGLGVHLRERVFH